MQEKFFDESESNMFDVEKAKLELKKALFEICKTEWDRSSALDRLIKDNGTLVVDLFGNNSFETMADLEDFYDFDDYENPETGVCLTFADWAYYFCSLQSEKLSKIIFGLLRNQISNEEIYSSLQNDHKDLASQFSIHKESDLQEYLESNDYEDEFLGVVQSLLEWKEFFDKDEFGLYNTCIELTEQNIQLTKKLAEIQNVLGH